MKCGNKGEVNCVSMHLDGKVVGEGCRRKEEYGWEVCNVDLPAVVNLVRRREVFLVVGRRLEDALERRHGCDRHLDEINQDCYAAKEA